MKHIESNSFDVEYGMNLIIKRNLVAFRKFFAENAPAKLRTVECDQTPVTISEIDKLLVLNAQNGNVNAACQLALRKIRFFRPQSPHIFNRVMSACAKIGDMDTLWTCWGALVAAGYEPDDVSLNIFLNACARARNEAQAESLIRALISNGKAPTLIGFSSLIDCFVKVGNIQKAEKWFKEAVAIGINLDVVIFNLLVNAYTKVGNVQKAESLLAMMPEFGLAPKSSTYNPIIDACAQLRDAQRVEHLYAQMCANGVEPDSVTYTCMIKAYARCRAPQKSAFWMEMMLKQGFTPTAACYNLMVHACAQCADLREAEKWLRLMKSQGMIPSTVTYTCLLSGYSLADDWEGISYCVEMMARNGMDKVAFKTLLKAAVQKKGRVQLAKRAMQIYCIVIGALLRVGALNNVRQLLDSKDVPVHAREPHQKFRTASVMAKSEADFVRALENCIAEENDTDGTQRRYSGRCEGPSIGLSEFVHPQMGWCDLTHQSSSQEFSYYRGQCKESFTCSAFAFDVDGCCNHFSGASSQDSPQVLYL